MKRLYWLSLFILYICTASHAEPLNGDIKNDHTIVGVWTVRSIEFSDCPQDDHSVSLDMSSSNCFLREDKVEVCVEMDMEFKSDGTLVQHFKTYAEGKVIDDTSETSHYTIINNKITICSITGNHCETSEINIVDGKLILTGRDVASKCFVLLKSTK